MKDRAEAYPLKVFPDALGLSPEGRGTLLSYGNIASNAFAPHHALFAEAMANAGPVRTWIMGQCGRKALSPDGLGAQVDAGELSEQEALINVRSFLSAGVYITVSGLSAALSCFACHPRQWCMLREKPALAPQAFEEAIRFGSPVQTFFHTTTREAEVSGIRLGDNDKVLCSWQRPTASA